MTASDVAAYIGAAAWAPQIIQWLYSSTKKPKLKAVSGGAAQIGYTGFGPVVGKTIAISCDRKDALIKSVRLYAAHEKGEKRQLNWSWLNESQMQMSAPTGEVFQFGKNEPALALKVSTLTLTQKTISFTDLEFQTGFASVKETLLHHFDYLKKKGGGEDPEDALVKSREFTDAEDFFRKNFFWKQGKYTIDIEFEIVGLSPPHKERFYVILQKADADSLQDNLKFFEGQIRADLRSYSGVTAKWPDWKWANPIVVPWP